MPILLFPLFNPQTIWILYHFSVLSIGFWGFFKSSLKNSSGHIWNRFSLINPFSNWPEVSSRTPFVRHLLFNRGGLKIPFELPPERTYYFVMPSIARHLLLNRKGKLTPFELTPERQKLVLGRVRGGSVHLLDSRRRPLTAFGVTHIGKGKRPLPN